MTTPTIRDHCATLAIDVSYLLMCIPDGSFDSVTLQEIADRADDARDALAAEAAGEGPTPAEIDKLTQQHTSDLGDLRIGVAPEDVPALVYAALARWGRPATPPAPEVGEGPSETAWALSQLLVGVQRHDLPNMIGLSDSDCDLIWAARWGHPTTTTETR
jgi:hypothetical protein